MVDCNSEFLTGYDWLMVSPLKFNGVPYPLTGATVEVSIVSINNVGEVTVLIPAIAQADSNLGADWPNGVLGIKIPKAITGINYTGKAAVEVSVTLDGNKLAWPRSDIKISKGTIP